LAAQLVAFIFILAIGLGFEALWPGLRPPLWGFIGAQSLSAAAFSRSFGLKGWWLVAQLALPVLAWGSLSINMPSWLYLVAFLLLFLVYSNVSAERVPLYLTNRTTWVALSHLLREEAEVEGAPHGRRRRFVDLGCGVGGMLAYLSRTHPDWDFVGVENAPGPYVFSRIRLWSRPNVKIEYKSLWDVDLSTFDVVYAFLSPAPMPRLLTQAARDLKPGAILISNSFWAPDIPYDGQIQVNDGRETCLFFTRKARNPAVE
jgi:SAM-dependent methyltransferase